MRAWRQWNETKNRSCDVEVVWVLTVVSVDGGECDVKEREEEKREVKQVLKSGQKKKLGPKVGSVLDISAWTTGSSSSSSPPPLS